MSKPARFIVREVTPGLWSVIDEQTGEHPACYLGSWEEASNIKRTLDYVDKMIKGKNKE